MRKKTPKTQITVYLDARTAMQLEEIAIRRNTTPFQVCQEVIILHIKENRTRITMMPEHYTARHAEEVVTE
jgi:hypothetical protein